MYEEYSSSHGKDKKEKCMHRDHFDTKREAKQAARRMGMSGCHSMQCNGKQVYMPGSNHSEYMDYQEGAMTNGSGIDPSTFGL